MKNHTNRKRKTISFKLEVYEKIEELRLSKTFSTFLNDYLSKQLLKGGDKR